MTKQFFALHCGRYNSDNEFEEYVETVEVSPSAGKPRHFFASNAKWGCSKDYPADPRSVALNLAAENAASVRKVEELPTYEAFETAARAAHERRFAAKGEAYATAEEMTYHREYPLETFELVEAEVCLELGARLERYGRVRYMSADDRAMFERRLPAPAPVEPTPVSATFAKLRGSLETCIVTAENKLAELKGDEALLCVLMIADSSLAVCVRDAGLALGPARGDLSSSRRWTHAAASIHADRWNLNLTPDQREAGCTVDVVRLPDALRRVADSARALLAQVLDAQKVVADPEAEAALRQALGLPAREGEA